MAVDLEQVRERVANVICNEIEPLFTKEMKLTLVARHETNPLCHITVTNDQVGKVAELLTAASRPVTPEVAPTPQLANVTPEERMAQLRQGVREDGTVEDHVVETYLATIYALQYPQQFGFDVDRENRFIAFQLDNGGTDLQVRLPFELVESFAKWIAAEPAK